MAAKDLICIRFDGDGANDLKGLTEKASFRYAQRSTKSDAPFDTLGWFRKVELNGSKGEPFDPRFTFDDLVRWAWRGLGYATRVESPVSSRERAGTRTKAKPAFTSIVQTRYPKQFLLEATNGAMPKQVGPKTAERVAAIVKERKDRGRDTPLDRRRLFKDCRTFRIDGLEVRYDSSDARWCFSKREMSLDTAVKVWVRILRDLRTREEWSACYVEWLADNEELLLDGRSSIEIDDLVVEDADGGTRLRLPLSIVYLAPDRAAGVATEGPGIKLVRVDDEEGDYDVTFFGDPTAAPVFPTWNELVDHLVGFFTVPEARELLRTEPRIPGARSEAGVSGWLAQSTEPQPTGRLALAGRYAKGSRVSRWKAGADSAARSAVRLPIASGPAPDVWLVSDDEGYSLRGADGSNPSLTLGDAFVVLAFLLADEATAESAGMLHAPWILELLRESFGVLASDTASSRTEIPAVPRMAEPPRSSGPVFLTVVLPSALSVLTEVPALGNPEDALRGLPRYRSPSDLPAVLAELESRREGVAGEANADFQRQLGPILAGMREELARLGS